METDLALAGLNSDHVAAVLSNRKFRPPLLEVALASPTSRSQSHTALCCYPSGNFFVNIRIGTRNEQRQWLPQPPQLKLNSEGLVVLQVTAVIFNG